MAPSSLPPPLTFGPSDSPNSPAAAPLGVLRMNAGLPFLVTIKLLGLEDEEDAGGGGGGGGLLAGAQATVDLVLSSAAPRETSHSSNNVVGAKETTANDGKEALLSPDDNQGGGTKAKKSSAFKSGFLSRGKEHATKLIHKATESVEKAERKIEQAVEKVKTATGLGFGKQEEGVPLSQKSTRSRPWGGEKVHTGTDSSERLSSSMAKGVERLHHKEGRALLVRTLSPADSSSLQCWASFNVHGV